MEDKLGTFISSLQANPNIAGLPDSTTLRNVFYDKEKAEVLFKSLKSNPNIMGLPEDYDTFAEGLGLSEQLQRPVMPELPTEEILDKRQKTNTSRSLPIYRGIAGNIPAAIFNKKLDKAVEKGELPEEDAKEIKKITEQNKWGDLGRSLGVSVLGAGEMALKIPQGLGGLAADISTRIQFPGMNRQINKAVKEGKMTVEQVNELWKTLQSPAFNPKTGQFEQGFIYGENLAESKLTKWFEDNQQKLKEQMTYTDKEIWDYIKEGDIEKAIWATAYGVTESLVPTILAAFTKQGAALLGLGTGSVAYDEVKDREDMMANKKIIDAVGQGVFEWFFEALFTKQMGDQFKAILKAKGTEGLKAAINSEATKNLIGKAFKKFGVWFNPVGEGVSELLTTLGQNAVAKYTGEDPTRKISDGAIDALIVGMGMGGGFSAIEGVAKKFKERPSDGQRTEDPVKPPTDDTTTEKQSTLDDIREQAKSEEQRIANEAKEMTREGTDEISFVTLANDSGDIAEKPRYVLKDAINEGKKEVVLLEIDPEGKLTGKKVMKMVSDLDVDKETGKVAMTTVKADEHIAAQINTMRETAQSAMNIMAKELSGLNEGDIFSEDGIRYVIEEVSTDGVAVSRLNEEGYVTGESELWSPDEVKEAMNAPTPADTQQAAPAEKVQQEAPETGTEEVDQPTTPQEQQQAAPVEQTQPQEQEQEQQKVEYPKDKEGNIDYNQITETGTYAEALEQEFGETSVSIVDEFIKNINEDIEKAGKGKDPIKKAREIKKLNDRLAFLDGVRNIIAPVREQELTDKARETTEQLEQVQERPPVQEAQVETVVPETKAADTARPINTRSKRKGWPMSKADQERLIKEPQSFEEAVLQFFLGGGRMSMDDYYTHFGKSREEMRKNIWMYSKKGQRLDALNENSIFASYPHLLRGLDGPMDMENAVFEVIRSHSGKNSIRERLDEIQNKPLEPEVPEDIQAEQNTDFEVENSEITGNDVIDEQLLSIFEEYYDNGEIDFSRLSEDLENDVGWFTVFPYNLSEQETNELKNILENADKRTKITDRVRNIVEPESGSQRDDTRDRTEEVERGDSGDRIPRVAETEATGTTPDTRAVESETLTEQESDKLKTGEQTELLFPDQEAIPQEPSETDSKDVAQFQIVQEENPLVVLHNTTEDKLIKSNRAGGLAMPSIAITKPSIGLSGFGDITLIGSKEIIDPQRTGTNKVYGADAYTPSYPNVVYTIGDKNALNNALKDIKDESVKNDIISGIENHIEREGDSYFDENKSVQLAFALNKGADVIVMRKTDLPREVIDFAEKTEGYDYLSIQGNEKAKTELNNVLLNSLDNKTKTLFERTGALKDGQISEKTLRNYFNEAKNWIRARGKVDFYGSEQNARDYIQKNNLQNEVKRFARDLYEQLNVNEKIFRGYTRTGNRRYAPHTVENAVREMKTEGNRGAENFFAGSLGYVRAMLAPRFKTIAQIKDASSRLVDNATSKAEFDRLDNLHKSLIEEIKPYYKYVADWFNEATAFGEEIKDLIKNGHSESFNQIPNELQAKIKQFAEDVVALPTDYFEAKPERGVMLSEFTAAVVPENTDSRVISILENNGLKVHKYGDNNRMEVVDRVSKDNNVLFQIASPLAINDKFNEDLSRMISGNLKIGHIFELGNPNHILKSAGLPDLPIQLNSSRLRAKSKQEEHPFDLSEIADLPLAIQNPLAVFRSATDIGSYVIFTDIPHKGENFIAAIEVNRVARNIAINSIRSVHYKKNNSILNWLDAELHNYLDKKRMIEWLNKQRSNSADVRQSFNHYANIINTFKNPSIYPENNNLFRILGETGASRLENAETVLNDLKVAREMENGGQHLSDAADFFFSQIPEELKVEARKYNRTEDAEAMKKIQANPKAKAAWANYIRAHEHLKEWQSLGEQEQKKRIRLATGWERGADGKWRYEVADNINIDKSVFNSLRSGETYNTVKLPELIGQDNDLFTTYPRLREVDVARNNINGAAVYSSGGNGQITINDKLTSLSAKSPLIHEIQHAIQAIEGFARGGNVDEFKRKYAELNERVDDYNKKLSKASSKGDKELYAQLMSDKMDAVKEILSLQDEYGVIGIKPYNNLAGEVEARNTETREGFTPEQRRETLLSETEDVAREEQIVLRQVLGEQSRTSPITETILELLEKAGIEVVMEKEAYNKAKEELLKANGVELKDGKGKVYGFAYQEKIYLDPDLVNPNTPIHEYTHLWDMALMKMDLELWDKGIDLLKQTPEWNRVVNDPNYANIRHSDDLIASEVHARLVGKDGPTILQEMIDNAKAESPVSHMEALSVVDRIKRWLKQVYVKLFGNKVKNSGDLTLEQWISMPIKDLFEGKRITGEYLEKSPENVKFTDKTEQHGSEGQQREQGTDAIRAPRLGSEPGSVRETHRILDELRHDVRGEGQDSGGTTATDNEAEGSERRKLQALATAEVRAKETGAWIGRNELSEIIDDGYRFTSGQESEVYLSKDRKSVIKLNNLSIISSVESFLYRIENFNKYFPKTKYEIIGFSENSEGEFCFVLKQPFIGNTKEASRQQIDDYFRDKGWYKIIDGEYTDGYVEMWDVYPKNVLTDEAGNLYFIDVNIDPARERYQKYKLPDVPQMEIRPAKEFVKGGVFDVNGYLNSLPERPNVPVDMLQSKSEKVVEHLQDRGLSLKKLQDLVKEKGNYDPKNMDAYMRENLSHGMAKNAIDTFDKTEKTALLKAMNATGLNYKEINDYLKAKHIPERNAYYKEKSGREISGGLSTEEAIRRAEGYESKIKETLGAEEGTKAINDLWKAVTDITDYTLKKWLEYGYLDREGYDRMKAMYDNYVPLRGFAASEIDQMIDYQEGQMGLGKNVNPLKKAKGRTTEADDPVQYMINMAYSSVVMGEKNRVKQTLARMVRGNPEMEDIFRFQRVYEVWDGTVDEDGNRNYTEVLERPAQELFDNGMVKTKTDNRHKIARTPYQAKAHESVFYIDGKRYVMVLPRDVADFVNKTRIWTDNLIEFLEVTRVPQFTRWLSNNFTSKNPAFIPINMIRDLGYSTMSHYVQGGTEQSKIFMGKLPEARRAIIDYLKDKGDPKNPVYSHYLDFMIHGGETGYVHLKNVEDIAVDMNKELKRLQGTNSLLDKATHIRVLRIAGKWLENMAIRSENLARFATYLTAIEMGKSQKEAAYAAKNISVNFNRKGRISSMMGGLFAFFNASVQGGENIIRIAKTNPKPFYGLAGTLMAMGFMEAMLNSMWGDDDEDGITNRYEDGVSNYTKYNNLVILIPGVDTAVTIALPHGFRWFHALGVISYQISQGHLRGGEATREALSNLFSSISPVDAVDFIDSEGGFSARPIIPTVGVPFFDIAVNENYAGFPIKREPFTRAQEGTVAEVTLGQRNVSKWAQKMSDWIFFLGGGDPETGSKMFRKEGKQHRPVPDMFDINPSHTEHFVEYYLGGRGRFWVDTFKTLGAFIDGATDVINGDKLFREMLKGINVNDLPVVRRLVQQPWDNVIMGMYYDEVEAIENYKSFVDLSTKAGAEIKYSPVYTKKIHAMKEAQKKVSDMNARIRQVDDRLTLEKLEEEREGIMRHFLETIKAIENESNRQ